MKKTVLATSILSMGMALAGASASTHADVISDAFKDGKTNVSFRLRHEAVEQDLDSGVDKNDVGIANTLKTRITYQTGEVEGFSVLAEIDNVSAFWGTSLLVRGGVSCVRLAQLRQL